MRWRPVFAAVLLLAITAPAWAGFDEGMAAYEQGDYQTALREIRPMAEQGNAAAQHSLSVMYRDGKGVEQNSVEAAKWLRRAAEQGHALGQWGLGAMYAIGEGVPQDYVWAHMWLNLAASRLPPGEARDEVVKNRYVIEGRRTSAQIAEAQRLAREWTEQHADQ